MPLLFLSSLLWPFVGGTEGEGEGCMLTRRTRECEFQRESRNCGRRRIGGLAIQKRDSNGSGETKVKWEKVIGVER